MGELKFYGPNAAFEEVMATAVEPRTYFSALSRYDTDHRVIELKRRLAQIAFCEKTVCGVCYGICEGFRPVMREVIRAARLSGGV
jgi:hypothetical protein